jgi:hypothetical protein
MGPHSAWTGLWTDDIEPGTAKDRQRQPSVKVSDCHLTSTVRMPLAAANFDRLDSRLAMIPVCKVSSSNQTCQSVGSVVPVLRTGA